MEFKEIIRNRYSCRKFDGRQVPAEALAAVLEAGRLAPTAKNLQEQRIYVIQSEEGLRKVDGLTPCRYGAPVVIAVAFDKSNVFIYPGDRRDSGAEDASIVATHMMHAALGLPDNEEILMFLDLGYAAEKHEAAPKKRKDLSETVSYL